MALDLKDWATGDTDYIATYNNNNAAIEAAVNGLETSKIDATEKGAANGVATLGSDSKVALGSLPSTIELTTHKGQANGYCELDSTAKIPIARIPDVTVSAIFGGVEVTSAKDQPSGYAGLDGSGLLKVAELPATVEVTGHKGAASGYCDLDGSAHVPASRLVAANIPDLSASYDVAGAAASAQSAAEAASIPFSQKGAASGVAELDSGGKVPTAQLPDLSGSYMTGLPSGAANQVIATATSGGSATAALRALVAADIPDLSSTYETQSHASSTYGSKDVMFPFCPASLTEDAQILAYFAPTFAVSFPANLTGTTFVAAVNPGGTIVFTLYKNAVSFGTVQVASDGTVTLTSASGASFNGTTDILKVTGPATKDTTIKNFGLTLKGTK